MLREQALAVNLFLLIAPNQHTLRVQGGELLILPSSRLAFGAFPGSDSADGNGYRDFPWF